MTTLGALKTTLQSDLDREDGSLDTEIAAAINTAIGKWQNSRFYFNERRSTTFDTVASQPNYGTADDADIPQFVRIDQAHITVSAQRYTLKRRNFLDMEPLFDGSAIGGQPYEFSYYNREIWLYPVPTDVWTIRVIGLLKIAAPASDGETDNPWMTEAYELIRSTAKAYLAIHKLRDPDLAAMMGDENSGAIANALTDLGLETALRVGTGIVRSTPF